MPLNMETTRIQVREPRFEFILNQEQLTVVVEDQGAGFNREKVADPLDPT